jgi:ketosteroid isomerase-like protein
MRMVARPGRERRHRSPSDVGVPADAVAGLRPWEHQLMGETNVELARRGFEAVLRGDLDLVSDLLDPDVKWHGGDPSAPGACRNREQALAFMRRARDRLGEVEVVDVLGAGDKVVVVMGPPAPDGDRAWTAANLTTFRDGKVVEIVHYPSPDDAVAAAGA